jgi:hydroxymethylpyrimidine pyrophosphatase-like HAD family hydrolase
MIIQGDTIKHQDVQIWNPKPPAFIIFADLDGTFTPMDIQGKVDFADVVREIHEEGDIQVKFVPVSGRPSGYVLRVLHDTRDMLSGMDVGQVCDYGAAEQGALLVDSSRSYGPQYIGNSSNLGLKQRVAEIIKRNKFASIVKDEPDKIYTCSIHIINEAKANMDHAAQRKVYESIRDDILMELDKSTLDISMSHNCMEVMSKEISKAKAIDVLLDRYRKDYNVVGMLYAGDAENDKNAIIYTSKLAEIPGMTAHVFEPANAQAVVDSDHLEGWKVKNKSCTKNRIRKGDFRMFKGITALIRDELAKGSLFGRGTGIKKSVDDDALVLRKKLTEEDSKETKTAPKEFQFKKWCRKYSHYEPLQKHWHLNQSDGYFLPNLTRRFSMAKDLGRKKSILDAI